MVSTHLKNISQNGNLPQIGVKIKNGNHHLASLTYITTTFKPGKFPTHQTPPEKLTNGWGTNRKRTKLVLWVDVCLGMRFFRFHGKPKVFVTPLKFNGWNLKMPPWKRKWMEMEKTSQNSPVLGFHVKLQMFFSPDYCPPLPHFPPSSHITFTKCRSSNQSSVSQGPCGL